MPGTIAARSPVFSILIILALLRCNRDDKPKVITVLNPAAYRPTSPAEIKELERVLSSIITVARDDLKIPTTDPIRTYLYKDTRAFRAAVAAHTNRDVTRLAAIAIKNEIHGNLEILKDIPWGDQGSVGKSRKKVANERVVQGKT